MKCMEHVGKVISTESFQEGLLFYDRVSCTNNSKWKWIMEQTEESWCSRRT